MADVRTRRTRRRYDNPPATRTALRGLLVIGLLVAAGVLATRIYDGIPGRDYETVYVNTPRVGNLLAHDAVRIAGVRVGQVLHTEIGPGGEPRLQLQLDPGTRVSADAKVAVRASGLLGARYVEIIPGRSPQRLAKGGTLTGGPSAYSFGLPEALNVFDAPTRLELGSTIDDLGTGLLGNGAGLNTTIGTLAQKTSRFDAVARTVLARRGATARLIPSLESTMAPLARNRGTSVAFNAAATRALGPFVEERGATRATLAAAPAALTAANAGLGAGERLLGAVDAFTGQANRTLPIAPAGLRGLGALLTASPAPLKAAHDLLKVAGPAVPAALKLTGAADPVLPGTSEALTLLTPLLQAVGEHRCDIVTFGTSMRSMTGFGQPGRGPAGPAGAFRLQAVAPLGGEGVGLSSDPTLDHRDRYSRCRWPSGEYPQAVPTSLGLGG